jgi:phosphomethylpyrimidine synthase
MAGAAVVRLGRRLSCLNIYPDTAERYQGQTPPAEGAKTVPLCSMCSPNFCSIKITQEVRDFAAKQNASADTFLEWQGRGTMRSMVEEPLRRSRRRRTASPSERTVPKVRS